MTFKALKRVAALAAALAVLAGLTGCGSASAPAGSSGTAVEKSTITVGTQAFAELAPLHIAIKQGFFKDEGLEVKLTDSTGGGAGLITGLVSGNTDIVYSNYVSLIQGAAKGLPLRVIRENDRPGAQALYVRSDSGITKPSDLAGKTIAINGFGNIMELTTRAVLGSHGVNQDQLKFVEIAPPQMEAALELKQVDAAWLVEPFVTTTTSKGQVKSVVSAFEGPTENLPVAGWSVTDQFAKANPKTTAAFVRAMDKAMAIAVKDQAAVVDAITSYTKIPKEVADKMKPIAFAEESDLSTLSKVQDLMIERGIINKPINMEQFVIKVDTGAKN
ncbi:ABC transporter substrate-binding protein [Pseudarthrobacter sp. NPDC058196]|uniref:ABC transporter substrate-binding protein n=1 Tax=Pseudarthrobacter sp. NPDC058196 TaxID=3346376 RepID=UPI0036DC335F